ncbi:MAG: M16 family metallopeptidase [bacterium]
MYLKNRAYLKNKVIFIFFIITIFNIPFILLKNYAYSLENIKYDIYQINNTKIYYIKSNNEMLSSFSIINKIGAYYDELSGQAHLCEHIFFKNKYNNNYIKYILSNNGAKYNAATFNDFIIFYLTSNNQYILKNIDIFLYSFFYPSFDQNDVNTEKNVVITELNTGYQDENIYKIFSKYYKPTGGIVNDIKKIDYNILYNYWKKNYTTDNMTIIIYSYLPFNYFNSSFIKYFNKDPKYLTTQEIKFKNFEQIESNLNSYYNNFIDFINKNLKDFETIETKDYIYFYIESKDNIIYYDLLSEIINQKLKDFNNNNKNNLELYSIFIPTKLSNFFIIKVKKNNTKDKNFYKNYILNIINNISYQDFKNSYLESYIDYLNFFSSNFEFIQFFSFLIGLNLLDIIQNFLNL